MIRLFAIYLGLLGYLSALRWWEPMTVALHRVIDRKG